MILPSAFGQFYVLEARDSYLNSKPINRFDLIEENGLVKVTNGGFLALIHVSGGCLEIEGKSKFQLEKLTFLDDTTMIKLPNYSSILNKPITRFIDGGYIVRDPVLYKCYEEYQSGFSVNIHESVCIIWEPNDIVYQKSEYGILVTNIFEEVLSDTLVVEDTRYKLHLDHLNVIDSTDYDYVLVYLINEDQMDLMAVINGVVEDFTVPDFCTPQTATEYVMAAYYLETNKLHKTALKFYEEAAKISKELIYSEVLEMAKIRMHLN